MNYLYVAYSEMALELRNSHHRVILIEAPEPQHSGHKIRMAESDLPEWYIKLLRDRPTKRERYGKRNRQEGKLRRCDVLRFLENPKTYPYKYELELRALAEEKVKQYEELDNVPF